VRNLLLPVLLIPLALLGTACAPRSSDQSASVMPPPPPPPPPAVLPAPRPPPRPTMMPPPEEALVGAIVGGTAGGAAGGSARPFPQFPCRPPNPSDLVTLDRQVAVPATAPATLGAVESRLKNAFVAAGFRQPRVYQTCGGFVLVTSIERARADGRPFAEPGRFVDLDRSMSAIEDFSLAGVLRALLTVQPGRFRMIAVMVSDVAIEPTGDTMSSAAAKAIATGGADRLPRQLAGAPFSDKHAVTALVYEFEKAPGSAEARLAVPPRFSANEHLRLTGVLDALRP